METTNATTIPTIRIITSVPVKEKPNFRIFRRLAPNMTGIPRKKVNSAATVREVPARIPPIMVEPERDVPGTTESTWNRPMMSAVLNDRFSRFVQVGLLLLVIILNDNEEDTIYDQCNGNYYIVIKFLFNDVIKRKCDNNRRYTGYYNFKPEYPFLFITELLHKSKNSSGYCTMPVKHCLLFL